MPSRSNPKQNRPGFIRLELLFSALASASIVSLFVVIPYTLGYFSFFDATYLSFFSPIDYYSFSAVPLLTALGFFALYYSLPYIPGLLRIFDSRGLARGDSTFRLGAEKLGIRLREGARVVHLVILGIVVIVFGLVTALFTLGHILIIGVLALLVIAVVLRQVFEFRNFYFFVAVFGLLEMLLFTRGFVNASERYLRAEKIEISIGARVTKANLAFAGAGGLLVFDDEGRLAFMRLDVSAAVVTVGRVRDRGLSKCLNSEFAQSVRNAFRRDC